MIDGERGRAIARQRDDLAEIDLSGGAPVGEVYFPLRTLSPDVPDSLSPSGSKEAGIVVGTNETEAVYWQNGVLDTLQHSVALAGPR